MRLLEFQAKRILAEFGIPVPRAVLMGSTEDLKKISFPVVLKAQVPAGGRGKAGAIRIVRGEAEAAPIVKEIFSSTVKGYPVQVVLAEELIDVERELYVAYQINKRANLPILMASAAGGVEIEEVAKKTPEQILKRHVDPLLGIRDFLVRPLPGVKG